MLDKIAMGEGVIHNGQIHTSASTLPTETDLAVGDAARTQAALDGIAAQRAQLDAQERQLLESLESLGTSSNARGGGRGRKGGPADAGQTGEDAPPPDDGGRQPGGAV